MKSKVIEKYELSQEGNDISVNHVKDDWYILSASDHYDENHVSFYVHKNELKGLADFINNYLESK